MWFVTIYIAACGRCGPPLERAMKGNRLKRLAGKILPIMHGRYQEMCSLAATGQLGGPQMSELNEHVAACDSCRKLLESVARVSIHVMPVLAEGRLSAAALAPTQGRPAGLLAGLPGEDMVRRRAV